MVRAILKAGLFAVGVVALVVSSSPAAFANDDVVVFGPTLYEKPQSSWLPTVLTDHFTLPPGVTGPFTIHVKNGRANGRDRVQAAWLIVNDVLIAGPPDFARAHQFDASVPLRSTNKVVVIIVGQRGFFEVTFFGRRPPNFPTNLTPNPLVMAVGARSEMLLTLAAPVADRETAALRVGDPRVAEAPKSVSFKRGQVTVPFKVKARAAGVTTIKATLNGRSVSATIRVGSATPRVVSLVPPALAVTQGASGSLTVALSFAPVDDTTVLIASSRPTVVGVSNFVIVPAGRTEASVAVEGLVPGTALVTATLGASKASSQVTVTPAPATLVSLLPPVSNLTLGASSSLQLTISAAQATDTLVQLQSTPAGRVFVAPTAVVPAGQTTAPVPIQGVGLGQAGVTAMLNGSTASALVNVVAPPLEVVALEPESVNMTVGATTSFTVRINAVQAASTEIRVESSDPAVLEVPAAVTIESGQTAATFVARALTAGNVVLTASANATSRQSMVHVSPQPAAIVALVPSPLPLQEGATGLLTVQINAAQEQATTIAVANTAPGVAQVPGQVTVPTGALTAQFPVTAVAAGRASITASVNGTQRTAQVEVTAPPPTVSGLTPATLILPRGVAGVLRVSISRGSATPVVIALSSSDLSVADVPAEVTVPAGALFAEFPVASLSIGEALITAMLGATVSAVVTVTAAEPVGLRLSPLAPSVAAGQSVTFAAIASMTDGTDQDLVAVADWSSSDTAVATIDTGVANGLSPGETTITVTYTFTRAATGLPSTLSANTPMTVSRRPMLTVTAPAAEVAIGESIAVTVSSNDAAPDGGVPVAVAAAGAGTATFPHEVTIAGGETATTFQVTGTGAGEVTLTATAPGYVAGSLTLTVRSLLRIDAVSPVSGPVGSAIELTGVGFEPSATANVVVFPNAQGGTVAAPVLSATATRLSVRVPPAAESGPIRVTNANGSATSPAFTVTRERDFRLVASPSMVTVYGGAASSAQVLLSSIGTSPFTGLVSLSAHGLPAGGAARFLPAPTISGNQHVVLELSAGSGTPPGAYPVTIRGEATEAGQPMVRTTTLDLIIQAATGVTGVKGRFVTPEGVGIAGVIVRADLPINDPQTTTDAAGNFQLVNLPAGTLSLRFDATPANPLYPIWPFEMTLPANQVTVLPDWTISPPPIIERFTPIANATQPQVVTDSRFPGLAIRLPAGVVIVGYDGVPKNRIAVEKVDIRKLPVPPPPTPTGAAYQIYFGTPMGGIPTAPIPVTLPNDVAAEPGESVDVWFFDGSPMARSGQWKIAGSAIVTPDGKSAAMPPGTGVPRFCGVCGLMCLGKQPPAPDPPPDSCSDGNPVELFTGQELPSTSGLSCRGLTPIQTGLSYNPVDAFGNIGGTAASMGFGWVLDYDISFLPFAGPQKRLVLPANRRVNFVDDGTGSYRSFDDPRFDGSVIRATNAGANEWELTFRDRTKWRFRPFSTVFVRGGPPTFLSEIVDPQGNVLPIQRQPNGRITSIGTTERGVTMTYGSNGFVSTIRDSADRAMRYTYTADDRLDTQTDADGRATRYTYVGDDEFPIPAVCPAQPSFGSRLKTITYPGRLNPTNNSYGPGRRVLRQIGFDGREHRFAYRMTGACVTHTSNPNVVCQGPSCPIVDSWENFLAGWRLHGGTVVATTVTRPDGKSYTHEFNSKGMTTDRTDAQGQRTSMTLDPGNRAVVRTDAIGRTWRATYDANGNTIENVDPLDRVTQYTYDPIWNRVTSVTRVDEANQPQTWRFTYDPTRGTLITSTNPLDETTRYSHTGRGELAAITTPLDQVTRFEYAPTGDLTSGTDPLGNRTRFQFDDAGRRLAETDPLGFDNQLSYNGVDAVTATTNPLGQVTRLDYDTAGRLAAVTNARGNLLESYTYDSGDRLTARTDAHGRSTTYTYDGAGRIQDVTNRRGQVTTSQYRRERQVDLGLTARGSHQVHV